MALSLRDAPVLTATSMKMFYHAVSFANTNAKDFNNKFESKVGKIRAEILINQIDFYEEEFTKHSETMRKHNITIVNIKGSLGSTYYNAATVIAYGAAIDLLLVQFKYNVNQLIGKKNLLPQIQSLPINSRSSISLPSAKSTESSVTDITPPASLDTTNTSLQSETQIKGGAEEPVTVIQTDNITTEPKTANNDYGEVPKEPNDFANEIQKKTENATVENWFNANMTIAGNQDVDYAKQGWDHNDSPKGFAKLEDANSTDDEPDHVLPPQENIVMDDDEGFVLVGTPTIMHI